MDVSDDELVDVDTAPLPEQDWGAEEARASFDKMHMSQEMPISVSQEAPMPMRTSDLLSSDELRLSDQPSMTGLSGLEFSDPYTRPALMDVRLFDSNGNVANLAASGGVGMEISGSSGLVGVGSDVLPAVAATVFAVPAAPAPREAEDDDSLGTAPAHAPDEHYDAAATRTLVPKAGAGFMCEWADCALGFPTLADLGAHIKNEHILEQKRQNRKLKMTGSRCFWRGCERDKDKPFNSFYNLEMHIRFLHTGEKPFECDFPGCTLAFSQQSDLKAHKALHTGERKATSPRTPRAGRVGEKGKGPSSLRDNQTLRIENSDL